MHYALLGLYATGILLLAFTSHSNVGDYCLFHRITSVACPACGTGHGVLALLYGNFGNAWRYNPLSYVAFPGAVYILFVIIADLIYNSNRLQTFLQSVNRRLHIRNYSTQFLILLLVINWIWNLYKY